MFHFILFFLFFFFKCYWCFQLSIWISVSNSTRFHILKLRATHFNLVIFLDLSLQFYNVQSPLFNHSFLEKYQKLIALLLLYIHLSKNPEKDSVISKRKSWINLLKLEPTFRIYSGHWNHRWSFEKERRFIFIPNKKVTFHHFLYK